MLGAHARGDGARRHPRPARRRLRALQRRPRLGGAALREDALRQRAAARRLRTLGRRRSAAGSPARPPTSCSRAGHRRGWVRLRARRRLARAPEGTSTSGPRPQLDRGARSRRRRLGGRLLDGHGRRHVRARRVHPPALARTRTTRRAGLACDGGCSRRASAACPAGPRRQGGRGLERARDLRAGARPARCSASRTYVDAAARCAATCSADAARSVDGRLRRVSRDGVVGAQPGCSRTTAASRPASSTCSRRPATPVWLERARGPARRRARALRGRRRRLLRHRRRRRGAGRPAARPVRQRLPVRAVGDGARAARLRRAHRLRRAPRRRRGCAAAVVELAEQGAAVRRLVAGRGRGPARRAGRDRGRRPRRRRSAPRSRGSRREAHPAAVVLVVADAGRHGIPLLAGRDLVDGRPAAYVCRDLVCERPVTDVAALREALAR